MYNNSTEMSFPIYRVSRTRMMPTRRTNLLTSVLFCSRPEWRPTSSFLSSARAPDNDSLIDMEIPTEEVCVAMLSLWWPLCSLRHPVFGHLFCPWTIYHLYALFPNNAPLHSFNCGEYCLPLLASSRCYLYVVSKRVIRGQF